MNQIDLNIDLDSLTPFWMIIDSQYNIIEASEYFKSRACFHISLQDFFEFVQPIVDRKSNQPNQILLNKIIHARFLKESLNFRFNAHALDQQTLLIGWPILSQLQEVHDLGLTGLMRHPACQIMDFLIIKDVLKEHQRSIRTLEVARYEAELEEQRRLAQHQGKLASLGEITAGVAHEIYNPLFICLGLAEMLERSLVKDNAMSPKISEYLKKQQQAHLRIKEIVQELKMYARADRAMSEIFSLSHVIKQTYELVEKLFKRDQIHVTYDSIQPPYEVRGSAGEIQQVVMNLLTNARHAIKHSQNKTIAIRLKQQNDRQVILSVTDFGQGIPVEVRDKIFKPFFTTKESDAGTGLGLAITARIIEKMGGEITFESKEGEGTSFFVTLPLASDHQTPLDA